MPISHKLKVIFIHIPKNAGESIEKTLGIYGLKNKDPKSKYWGVLKKKIRYAVRIIPNQIINSKLLRHEERNIITEPEVFINGDYDNDMNNFLNLNNFH